jgi:hypothetical protein
MMWMMIMGSNHWWLIVMGIRKHYFLYRVYLFRKKTFFFNFSVTFHTKYIYFFFINTYLVFLTKIKSEIIYTVMKTFSLLLYTYKYNTM